MLLSGIALDAIPNGLALFEQPTKEIQFNSIVIQVTSNNYVQHATVFFNPNPTGGGGGGSTKF